MRSKKVWRYYCDHCNRGSCGKPSMQKHETRCIKNPGRHCGFCEVAQLVQKPVDELVKALIGSGLNALKEAASNCPACVLTAIVKARGLDGEYVHWDYKKAVEAFWKEHNANQSTESIPIPV